MPEYCLELKSRHSFRKGTPNQVAFRWVLYMGLIITLIAEKVCRGQWYTLHPYPEVCFLVIKQISHFLHGSWTFHSYANVWDIALSRYLPPTLSSNFNGSYIYMYKLVFSNTYTLTHALIKMSRSKLLLNVALFFHQP